MTGSDIKDKYHAERERLNSPRKEITMRLNYYRFPEETPIEVLREHGCDFDDMAIGGCSVTFAKKMLREHGGEAWTEHLERDGGCFEVTEIKLTGNNSRFKYNHHL